MIENHETVLAQFGDFRVSVFPNGAGSVGNFADQYLVRDTANRINSLVGNDDIVDMIESPNDNGRAACRFAFYSARRYDRTRRRKFAAACFFCMDVGTVFSMGYWRRVPCNNCQPNA